MAYNLLLETATDKLLLEDGTSRVLLDAGAVYSTFSDNFNDNSINGTFWANYGGAQLAETNQHIEINNINSAGFNYYGMETQIAYDLEGSYVQVSIVDGTQVVGRQCLFYIETDVSGANQVMFFIENSVLTMRYTVATVQNDTTVAYNGTSMKWLRISESAGSFLWDSSPDGVTWTNRRTTANTLGTTTFLAQIVLGTYQAASISMSIFDEFNIVQSAAATARRLSLLGVG